MIELLYQHTHYFTQTAREQHADSTTRRARQQGLTLDKNPEEMGSLSNRAVRATAEFAILIDPARVRFSSLNLRFCNTVICGTVDITLRPPSPTTLTTTSSTVPSKVPSTDSDWLLTKLGSAVALAPHSSAHGTRAQGALSLTMHVALTTRPVFPTS
jgi:hypothetical protein